MLGLKLIHVSKRVPDLNVLVTDLLNQNTGVQHMDK